MFIPSTLSREWQWQKSQLVSVNTSHHYTLQSSHSHTSYLSLSLPLIHFILPFYTDITLHPTSSILLLYYIFFSSSHPYPFFSKHLTITSPKLISSSITKHNKPIYTSNTLIIHSVQTTGISQITNFQCLNSRFLNFCSLVMSDMHMQELDLISYPKVPFILPHSLPILSRNAQVILSISSSAEFFFLNSLFMLPCFPLPFFSLLSSY